MPSLAPPLELSTRSFASPWSMSCFGTSDVKFTGISFSRFTDGIGAKHHFRQIGVHLPKQHVGLDVQYPRLRFVEELQYERAHRLGRCAVPGRDVDLALESLPQERTREQLQVR